MSSLPFVFQLPLEFKRWHCTGNEAIQPKFLDLKEGALITSLEPFAVGARRLVAGVRWWARGDEHAVAECNVGEISAILDSSAQDYHSMDVSWGPVLASSMCIVSIVPGMPVCALASMWRGGASRGVDFNLLCFLFFLFIFAEDFSC